MKPESMLFVVIVWVCAAVFISIGIFSLKKKTPMHFWAGTAVKSEEISNIGAYNRANGIMWIVYGSVYVLAGLLSLISGVYIGAFILIFISMPGLIILIMVYGKIYDKYKI